MKKIICLLMCLMMTVGLFTGCGEGKKTQNEANSVDEKDVSEKTLVLRLAHCNPEGDPTDLEAKKFAELVEKYSDGKVKVDIYPNAILGDWTELLDGLKLDTEDIMIEGFGDLESYSLLGSLDAIPFLYNGYDQFMKVWHGDIGQKICDDVCADCGIKIFGGAYRGARVVTSTKPFTNAKELADLGLKIRVPNTQIYVKTWESLKTYPTPLALTEVLTGLQQKTVEAQENPCIMSYNYGFYDVCDYIVKTNHVYSATVFMIDNEKFASYAPDVQNAILKAAEEASVYVSEYIRDNEEDYFKKFEEKGCTVIEPDRESFAEEVSALVTTEFPSFEPYVELINGVE